MSRQETIKLMLGQLTQEPKHLATMEGFAGVPLTMENVILAAIVRKAAAGDMTAAKWLMDQHDSGCVAASHTDDDALIHHLGTMSEADLEALAGDDWR